MNAPHDEYAQLRQLLLQIEQDRLDELEKRLNDPQLRSQEIAAILAQAIERAPDLNQLASALKKPVQTCIIESMCETPQTFARPLLTALSTPIQKPIQARLTELEQQQINPVIQRLTQLETLLPRFEQLVAQLDDTEKRVSDMANFLPEAINKASISEELEHTLQSRLTESLKEPVQRCLRQSISEDTQVLADTLFPVMGPAIRKSINETFKDLLQEINTRLQQSPFSPKGLVWRWEAWRTSTPLQEIILRDTLVYRVEQVFLIHRDSGLLIHHLHQNDIEINDSDAVSAMLTAIQDFIHDSFSGTDDAQLERVEIGEFTVWLERGPDAILASVIRGNVPYSYKDIMHDALETMHARYGFLLEKFDGDNSTLTPILTILQKTLGSEIRDKQGHYFPPAVVAAFAGISALAVALLAWFAYEQYRIQQHREQLMAYVETLRQTPGIVPVQANYEDRHLILHGLRDPLAADPLQIALTAQVSPNDITASWTPYQDLTPVFVEQRAKLQLAPPDSVELQLKGDVLHISGRADRAWIEHVQQQASHITGIRQVVGDQLIDNDAYWQQTDALFQNLLQRLRNTPGLVIISHQREAGHRVIRGLRDPLAADPNRWAEEIGLHDVQMHWQAHHDLTPEFVLQRARLALQPPTSIQLHLGDDAILHFTGEADQLWLTQAQQRALSIAGIRTVNLEQARPSDAYWLNTEAQFQAFIATLNSTQGIIVTDSGRGQEQRYVRGLRDPLAPDPQEIADKMGLERLTMHWQMLHTLSPAFVLQRARHWLQPPPSVELAVQDHVLFATGQASAEWIKHAYHNIGKIAGINALNTENLTNTDQAWQAMEVSVQRLLTTLNTTPGLVVTDSGRRDGHFYIHGLRDPLAPDPQHLAQQAGLSDITMRWQHYQELSPAFVLRRARAWLQPPHTIELSLNDTVLTVRGNTDKAWLDKLNDSVGKIAGIDSVNTEAVTLNDAYWVESEAIFQALVTVLRDTDGLTVIHAGRQGEHWLIRGLRDPLAVDPQELAGRYPDLRLKMHWQPYHDLSPVFVLKRAHLALQPPPGVELHLTDDRILQIRGAADHTWISQIQTQSGYLTGIREIDTQQLSNQDAVWQAEQVRLQQLVAELNRVPGIIVVDSGKNASGEWMIHGLRDPQADFPEQAVIHANLPTLQQEWQFYQDLSPAFVQARLQQQLKQDQLDVLQLSIDNQGVVQLTGEATGEQIRRAASQIQQEAGVKAVDTHAAINMTEWQEQATELFEEFLATLGDTPGIVVTYTQPRVEGGWLVQGLRDPLAADPQEIARQFLLDGALEMYWHSYQDVSPEFLLKHAQQRLQPPPKVNLTVRDQVLHVEGEASAAWIKTLAQPLGLPLRIDSGQLINIDQQNWQAAMARLMAINVLFNESTEFQAQQNKILRELTETLRELIKLSEILDYQMRIEIIGETDGLGTRAHNLQLGTARAQRMKEWLMAQGIAGKWLHPMSTHKVCFGDEVANFQNRRVHFRLVY
ncbi:OmpA family protein [Thioflexithrix psekupsensis]|uniref:OmpA-like domain-containing protein n=1 Tax=Thioflexithrix psekupsensis TaxID=1570016 RepID=A0A251X4L8_9GAMM|nr:BON domain-containing protein [Thioflexithrix psekupsensis]OUD12453.1 hypothetical protein TPSD3_15210 [Thioflexithrix psekupsensis]